MTRDGAGADGPRATRRTLITSDPAEFSMHDHVAWSGDGPAALDRLAVATFAPAARRGALLLFVADDPDPDRLAELEDADDLVDRGVLHFASTADAYGTPLDVTEQRAVFEGALDAALADGFTGICVVADNSALAAGSDDEFAAWLEWEATADRLQANRPINGVCFFDTRKVPDDRLQDVAVLHPVLSADFARPNCRVVADDGVVRLLGEVDAFNVDQLGRVLDAAPQLTDYVLDLAEVGFMDHRALLRLNTLAAERGGVCVTGARPVVRRLWALLDVPAPALEFC